MADDADRAQELEERERARAILRLRQRAAGLGLAGAAPHPAQVPGTRRGFLDDVALASAPSRPWGLP